MGECAVNRPLHTGGEKVVVAVVMGWGGGGEVEVELGFTVVHRVGNVKNRAGKGIVMTTIDIVSRSGVLAGVQERVSNFKNFRR